MKRRDFLKTTAVAPAAVALNQECYGNDSLDAFAQLSSEQARKRRTLERRRYGRSKIHLSIIGFGGYMLNEQPQGKADRVVADAVERGVNYFDIAPTYGNAQELLGPALEPFRKDIFLACKTTQRSAEGAAKELKASLKALRTDHFDLYQLHGIKDVTKDVDAVFAKGGAMETFLKAKQDGRVRHIGFSAHSVEAAMAALDRYPFDSILFPINFACFYKGSFGPQVVAKAQKVGAAILAIKAMARQRYRKKDHPDRKKYTNCWYQPLSDPERAAMGMRFALAQPITALVPPADPGLFQMGLRMALAGLNPITDDEQGRLREMAKGLRPVFTAKA